MKEKGLMVGSSSSLWVSWKKPKKTKFLDMKISGFTVVPINVHHKRIKRCTGPLAPTHYFGLFTFKLTVVVARQLLTIIMK